MLCRLTIAALAVLGVACASAPPAPPPADARVDIAFLTEPRPEDHIDSATLWSGIDGERWLIASGKSSDTLLVYDASSGRLLREVGGSGNGLGQFRRPIGVFAIDELLFVVERDNARVQVLTLPAFEPVGEFGSPTLRRPYGLWIDTVPVGWYRVYVTDDYRLSGKVVPPDAELGKRVQVWQVRRRAEGDLRARYARALGPTEPPGALRAVESIHGDRTNLNLLIAEEDETRRGSETGLKLFTMDGIFKDRVVGVDDFRGQPEGIALWACDDGSGYWLAADQSRAATRFLVFDRRSLELSGSFHSPQVSNTDGIWLHQQAIEGFPEGVLYVLHDDQAVAAIDWRAIADAVGLRRNCDAG